MGTRHWGLWARLTGRGWGMKAWDQGILSGTRVKKKGKTGYKVPTRYNTAGRGRVTGAIGLRRTQVTDRQMKTAPETEGGDGYRTGGHTEHFQMVKMVHFLLRGEGNEGGREKRNETNVSLVNNIYFPNWNVWMCCLWGLSFWKFLNLGSSFNYCCKRSFGTSNISTFQKFFFVILFLK